MFTNKQWEFMESLEDKEYRRVFAEEHVGTGLAFQIRRMREAKPWTQEEMAQLTGKAQETISQWENPNYGRYSISTLKQLAAAFDVALLVRFVSFSELADWTVDVIPQRLTPPSYNEERRMSFGEVGSLKWLPSSNIEEKMLSRDLPTSTQDATPNADLLSLGTHIPVTTTTRQGEPQYATA